MRTSRSVAGEGPILAVFLGLSFLLAFVQPRYSAAVPVGDSFEAALSVKNGPARLLDGIEIDAGVPTPEAVLGYELCSRPSSCGDILTFLKRLSEASPRIQIRKYGETYEGRDLYYAAISSEENMKKLDAVKLASSWLADPRTISDAEAEKLIGDTPAVAWLEFSIHGDELSGADAALFLAYYLVAAQDSLTRALRDELVILIDPIQNPDGRERFLVQLRQFAGTRPNPDPQSLEHSSVWPWGRTNHYFFDLNRDWVVFLHPETRSRAATILDWHPQLVVDAHEMGAFDTFMFSPPREPFNPNVTASLRKWLNIYSQDQAAAVDRFGWSYYTEEWNEEWGPFYANVWASHTGAIGILYEQAGVEGTGVRRPDGTYLGYPEAVLHHVVSSIANLSTTAAHREEILRDFYVEKKKASDRSGSGGGAYVIPRGSNTTRTRELISILQRNGIEVHRAKRQFLARNVKSASGEERSSVTFSPGAYVVFFAQPMSSLLKTIFEFDPRMITSFLEQERDELEKRGETKLYEVTAWSLPLAFDVETYEVRSLERVAVEKVNGSEGTTGTVTNPAATYGFLLDYSDDAAIRALARLFERDCKVRAALKPFRIGKMEFGSGTLLVTLAGNPDGLPAILEEIAGETGVRFHGVNSALTDEGPDLGGGYFRLLRQPRIAVLTGSGIDFTSYGTLWYLLDREYGYRFSALDINRLGRMDLDKYNVLVLPSVWGSPEAYLDMLGKNNVARLKRWVEQEGTLICIGAASIFAADTTSGLSKVRLRRQSLELLGEFEETLAREDAMKARKIVDSLEVWEGEQKASPDKRGTDAGSRYEIREQKTDKAIEGTVPGKPDVGKLKREDEWLRKFMPRGAILKADLDTDHWLSFGMGESVPVILYSEYVLLSRAPVETACRLSGAETLRMSGLLWPEARKRWARAAFATREGLGRGQVILFADEPYFRGNFRGSGRMLANALFLGPGIGTSVPAPW